MLLQYTQSSYKKEKKIKMEDLEGCSTILINASTSREEHSSLLY